MSTFDAGKTPARNSYDSEVPPNLLEFMLKSWNPKGRKAPKVLSNAATFRTGASGCRRIFRMSFW